MTRLYIAALLACAAAPALAQPTATAAAIEPSPDSAAERQALRTLTACLAKARPRWARHTLSLPYLSDAQAYAASRALSGTDSCVPRTGAEYTFRTSSMVGALADHFLRPEIQRTDTARLASALSATTPLNVSEDFALCVAARDPASARDLVLSEPGGAAETQAVRQFVRQIDPCTNEGEELTVDLQSLRALISTAIYRGIVTDRVAAN
jgi:hypothetical protein